jgi:hypothetical protein
MIAIMIRAFFIDVYQLYQEVMSLAHSGQKIIANIECAEGKIRLSHWFGLLFSYVSSPGDLVFFPEIGFDHQHYPEDKRRYPGYPVDYPPDERYLPEDDRNKGVQPKHDYGLDSVKPDKSVFLLQYQKDDAGYPA